jgi:four helix bundle protein
MAAGQKQLPLHKNGAEGREFGHFRSVFVVHFVGYLVEDAISMLAHENLQVYGKVLKVAAQAFTLSSSWDKRHALVDHLSRASESIVLNLAEAARLQGSCVRLTIIEYAIGSSLECAACFDLALIKQLLSAGQAHEEKSRLCEVTKMLIGLRRAWEQPVLEEEALPYETSRSGVRPLFHHETLDVYRLSLKFVEWFESQAAGLLPNRLLRQVDDSATSMVLNITEGNGRYAYLDQRRFLRTAHRALVKTAAYLDLCSLKGLSARGANTIGKEMLDRIAAMLARMEQPATNYPTK